MRHVSGKAMLVAFVSAGVLAAAGCHSSSPSSAASGPGSGGAAQQSQPTGAASTSAPATGATTSATPSASSTTATGGSASGAGRAAGGSTTGTTSHGSAAKPPGRPTGFARAGTYTYDLSGTAQQPLVGRQNVSGTQSLAVDPPRAGQQHTRASGANGTQDQTLASRSTGLYVVDIHISQTGFDEDFRPTSTALFFPADYKVGRHWSWQARSTDGKYTITVATKISGTARQTVGGKALTALVVDSTLHITGSGFDITDQQRDWVSTTYALVLREHAVTSGTAYGAAISSDITRTLRSTTPA